MPKRPDRRRDYHRRAAAEVALALAEMNAGWGDHASALKHLYAADEICGGVLVGRFARRPELAAQRDEWVSEAMAEITA
jgi:hypothetical protein